jgi:RNA polymerase sigma-70 factor (ECF subfamily)
VGEDIVGSTPPPEAELIAREERAVLEEAIARLSEDYRRVILLRHKEGLSFAAVGQALGRSADAARKLWARAVEALQELMERHEPQ